VKTGGITSYGELRSIVNASVKDGLDLYDKLCAKFRSLDEQYNGNLFKAHISEQLIIPAQLLADFLRSLYPMEAPYRFDAIGDDILGIIYERFLGSTITVDEHNNVDAKEKPEVRHAGGVYYTPKFVVDTIVRRVIGPKIEGKKPAEILELNILDPACGSGSFLIAALQYLYDYCTDYLSKHPKDNKISVKTGPGKKQPITIGFRDDEGNWHISPDFRAQLLSSCIYGVDIDMQAAEVTVMSLYLKMLEGKLPPNWQRAFLRHKLLPSLDNNINCGNSLISQTDFDRYWEKKHSTLFGFDEDTRFRINAFDWTSETRGFGRILKEKEGFDCIIGNPPYIRVQELKKWEPEECEFYKSTYKSAAKGNYDIYVVFIEKALQLLNPDGLMGYICPNKVINKEYASILREQLSLKRNLRELIHFGANQIFTGATTYTCILVLQNKTNLNGVLYIDFPKIEDAEIIYNAVAEIGSSSTRSFLKSTYANHPKDGSPWILSSSNMVAQMASFPRLNEIANIFVGIQTDADDVYYLKLLQENKNFCKVFCSHTNKDYRIESSLLSDLLQGTNVVRFTTKGIISKVIFPFEPNSKGRYEVISDRKMSSVFPCAHSFFQDKSIQTRLKSRAKDKLKDSKEYWDFIYRKNLAKQSLPKICVPRLSKCLTAALDYEGSYCLDNVDVCGIIPKSEKVNIYYLTALLNSKLLDSYMKKTVRDNFRGGYLSLNKQFLGLLPIKICCETDHILENQIIEITKNLIKSKTIQKTQNLSDYELSQLEREIEAGEKRIDELVCKLYGVDTIPD